MEKHEANEQEILDVTKEFLQQLKYSQSRKLEKETEQQKKILEATQKLTQELMQNEMHVNGSNQNNGNSGNSCNGNWEKKGPQ